MPDHSAGRGFARLKRKIAQQPKLRFWLAVLWATFTSRRVSEILRLQGRTYAPCRASGMEHLPDSGPFTLAVNHYIPSTLMRILTAVLQAVQVARPDACDQMQIVAGRRPGKSRAWFLVRWFQSIVRFVLGRWSHNLISIDMDGEGKTIRGLRDWLTRARTQPVLVLPEGQARSRLGALRPGVGKLVRSCGTPVIPVAVWFDEDQRIWQVRFGPPVKWSSSAKIEDLQLGIAMARLLPADLARDWQPILDRLEARKNADASSNVCQCTNNQPRTQETE